ncbi:Aste57867_18081 [Aphanomyces stellatus]|uniref:Large ribosomal subunit protein bL32m n=1 Tax=Aphanomyces stellatus TaxID=120398 RepID=A0A485L942_9STRA|nr:hypothetical protein As57867_018019 [Aphanomyces stellatus]VFT94820.1 Aste57867_18081 [Aphanomyces stellatus]
MDRSTRRGAQRQRNRKAKSNGNGKDGKDGDHDTSNGTTSSANAMRSPPPPRSRSLLQQQEKEQGDGTAVSDSESDDEMDSDKETTYTTLLQALNTHLDDADGELKKVDKGSSDAEANAETVVEFKERMLELKTKVQMIEDGTFAEYCRRCVDFKDDRSRSLETAKQHKELQLKNIEDLRRFDLQQANHLYGHAKDAMKQGLAERMQAMLVDVDVQLACLDEDTIEKEDPARDDDDIEEGEVQEDEKKEVDDSSSMDGKTSEESHDTTDDNVDDDGGDDGGAVEPVSKKPKLDFHTLDVSGPFADKIKAHQQGYKTLPYQSMTALAVDDIQNDLHAVCLDWKTPPPTEKPLETVAIHYARGILWCGKYIFDEGDEVVVSSKVMKREYIGVIDALTPDAVFLRLNTGEKARVYYTLLQAKRCEIKPILRGNSGLKNLQSSGPMEALYIHVIRTTGLFLFHGESFDSDDAARGMATVDEIIDWHNLRSVKKPETMALVRLVSSVRRMLQPQQWSFLPQLEVLPGVTVQEADEEEENDSLWHAAPKSKVTRSRKRIHNNDPSKRLKNIVHLQDCEHCGSKKLRHRLCMGCFKKGEYFTS